jgi:hypothetical protein
MPHPETLIPPHAAEAPSSPQREATRPDAQACVGQMPAPMSDAERESAIKRAGLAVERHMAEYERTGCFAARGNADRARLAMQALIRGRSAARMARMERERGLDLPACANEGGRGA